jgi:Zn-dependent peptidase ImmA (M78 family)
VKIPKEPRYKLSTIKAHQFIIEHKINAFPVDPFQVAETMDITLMSYSELSRENDCSIDDIIRLFGSEDGFSLFQGGYYCVAFNDDLINSDKRLNFTILHELGHIYLNHFIFEKTTLLRNGLSRSEYEVLEREVDCFARNVLAPSPIVNNLEFKHPGIISNIFNISLKAANTRLSLLKNDIYNASLSYGKIEERFYRFIYKMTHTYRCNDCGIKFLSDNPHNCKLCRSKNISKSLYFTGVDNQMIYKGFTLDKNGRAIICPKCENEELYEDADNCKICNAPIINKCAETQIDYNEFSPSCGAILDGNARYCKCGNVSTFFQQELLKDWETERKAINGIEEKNTFLKK